MGSGTLDASSVSLVVDGLTSEPLVEVLAEVTVDLLAELVGVVNEGL